MFAGVRGEHSVEVLERNRRPSEHANSRIGFENAPVGLADQVGCRIVDDYHEKRVESLDQHENGSLVEGDIATLDFGIAWFERGEGHRFGAVSEGGQGFADSIARCIRGLLPAERQGNAVLGRRVAFEIVSKELGDAGRSRSIYVTHRQFLHTRRI